MATVRAFSPLGGDDIHGSRAGTPDPTATEEPKTPTLLHRLKHDRSILSLAVSDDYVYAGSQSGEILIWSIETFELIRTLKGHSGSVLCLYLTPDRSHLFSSAGDAIIQIWDAQTFENLYTIYSTYDVGDVFCVAFSEALQTAWFGAQNTSIQWYDLKARDSSRPTLTSHPSRRSHRFFDSKGPGGRSTPRPSSADADSNCTDGTSKHLEIHSDNIVQYAHFGYVYCMLAVSGVQIGQGDGEVLLSGGGDGDVKLWNVDENGAISELNRLEGGDSGVLSMAIQDTFLYCGLTDGEIWVWDLDTLQLVRTVKAHCDDVLTVSVQADCIFSGSASGYTRKWNSRFECLSRWHAHSGLVLASVVTTRNGRILYITGGNDDTVSLWDVSALAPSARSLPENSQNLLLASLTKLVSYQTVSTNPEDCRRAATYLKSLFKHYGASSALLPTDPGHNPIVFARFSASKEKKGKTTLFYGHYDVIPASSSEKGWNTDPFSLTGLNGYLYGRGVSDNKGPLLAALFAAADLASSNSLTGDIIFLIEGEEETGSRGFESAVRANRDLIGPVDWILFANSYWLDDTTPCLTYGLRGVVQASVSLHSSSPDLHSGVDGSSLYREPTTDLITLLSLLTDASTNRIRIPSFYDPVSPLSAEEQEMYTPVLDSLNHTTTLQSLVSKWRSPSLTIHSLRVSGPTDNPTIIPAAASASLSLRIVPEQSPRVVAAQLSEYLKAVYTGPHCLAVDIHHTSEPWLGDPRNAAYRTLQRELRSEWGKDPVFIREGGSIPGIGFLERELGARGVHLPCGQGSDGAHLVNERLRVRNLVAARRVLRGGFEGMGRAE